MRSVVNGNPLKQETEKEPCYDVLGNINGAMIPMSDSQLPTWAQAKQAVLEQPISLKKPLLI